MNRHRGAPLWFNYLIESRELVPSQIPDFLTVVNLVQLLLTPDGVLVLKVTGLLSMAQHPTELRHDATLTPRQRQVLTLVAEGKTTKEIAKELSVSFKTAAAHRANLMQKLDIHDTAHLVRYAIRNGFLEP